eukprot:SAG31_NODE_455_length_15433_cov_4.248728_3_plen_77_part_00
MFEAYNTVLRAYANDKTVPEYSALLKWRGLPVKNRFTSTIHAINSGILKLSRFQVYICLWLRSVILGHALVTPACV